LGSGISLQPVNRTPNSAGMVSANSGSPIGSTPEVSTVQWGVSGNQNLFSDSWNVTPSPGCLSEAKYLDFSSTAGQLLFYFDYAF
jgi:hypothetical protein